MAYNRGLFSNCLLRFKDRIKTNKEIFDVVNSGTIIKCRYFNFYIKKNRVKRIGILIRKFQKGTVERNKVKRIIREIYRNNKELFLFDTIIKIKKDLHTKSFIELKNEIVSDLNNLPRGIKSE